MSSKFKFNTAVYGLSVMFERLISFFLLPVLTKNLSTEYYGIWSQTIITSAFISGFILLHLQVSWVKYFSGLNQFGKSNLQSFNKILTFVLINLIFISLVCAFLSDDLSLLIFDDIKYSDYIISLIALLGTEVFFEMVTAYLRAGEKIALLSFYYILKSVGRILILYICIGLYKMDLLQTIYTLSLWQVLILHLIYFKDINTKFEFSFAKAISLKEFKIILAFSIPQVIQNLFVLVNNFSDRYLILHKLDLSSVGKYSVVYSFASIIAVFYSVLGFTLFPRLANLWNEKNWKEVKIILEKIISVYLFFVIPSVLGITFLYEDIINAFSTSDYLVQFKIPLLLSLGVSFFGIHQIFFYTTVLAEKNKSNIIIVALTLTINVLINYFLLAQYGVIVAAWSNFISNFLLMCMTLTLSRKIIKIKWPIINMLRILVGSIVMISLLIFLKSQLHFNSSLNLVILVFCGVVIYLFYDFLFKDSFLKQLRK